MSDEVSVQSAAPIIDGKNLINVPGASGITSINADNTPAQIIAGGDGIDEVSIGPVHALKARLLPLGGLDFDAPTMAIKIKADPPLAFGGVTGNLQIDKYQGNGLPGYVPDPAGAPAGKFLNDAGGFTVPPGTFTPATFGGVGVPGYVPDPTAGASNRRLQSDGTWFIPKHYANAPGAITCPDGVVTLIADLTIAANEGGDYLVEALVSFDINGTGYRLLIIEKNGTPVRQINVQPIASVPTGLFLSMVLTGLAAGNVIAMYGYQNSGGPLDTQNNAIVTSLNIYRLGN
jgi:hypothetical protein